MTMAKTSTAEANLRVHTRPHEVWTLVIAGMGLFMAALDTLVVTTALPVIRVDLKASLGDLEWTVNAYNLAFACLLLTAAAIGDRFGRKRVFAAGLTLFTVASAGAALTRNIDGLIVARVFQGTGAAIVMPLTLTLISEAFPPAKRGMAIGLWGGIAGLAIAAGPMVGGAITDRLDWHWIFWLNVPVGAVLVPLAGLMLTESHGPNLRIDFGGVVLAAAGLFCLTWGLVRGNTAGWASTEVLAFFAAGAALLALFIVWESKTAQPVLSLSLSFTGRNSQPPTPSASSSMPASSA